MPDNDEPKQAEEQPKVPTVEDRFKNYANNASPFSGDGFDADWYGDRKPEEPGGLDL